VSEPIRVALFGNGFARTVILPCLRLVEGIRLVGIYSPNQERAEATARAFGLESTFAEHGELLSRARPDLVFITTPPHRHAEMAIDALGAGCHVVCEKPMALNVQETARMLAAARANPSRLALINHELRVLPARVALRELVEQGRLGPILKAEYVLHSTGRRNPTAPWSWWSDSEQGGGALGAIGSHAIDALRVLMGEIAEVSGTLDTWIKERLDLASGMMRRVTTDDHAAAWFRFRSGALGAMTLSMVETERVHRIRLTGEFGSARLDEQGPLITNFDGPGADGRGEAAFPVVDDLPPSAQLGIPESDWARAFLRLARMIVADVRAGRTHVIGAATFEDGHRTQMVLDAVRRSNEEQRWVRVGD
jgi:predicted dehydrogenase